MYMIILSFFLGWLISAGCPSLQTAHRAVSLLLLLAINFVDEDAMTSVVYWDAGGRRYRRSWNSAEEKYKA
jgi:hypothetical protein